MKKYEMPTVVLLLFSSDLLLASDENELAIDKLASIFDLKGKKKKAVPAGTYRKAVFCQYQKGRGFLVPFAHFLACKV